MEPQTVEDSQTDPTLAAGEARIAAADSLAVASEIGQNGTNTAQNQIQEATRVNNGSGPARWILCVIRPLFLFVLIPCFLPLLLPRINLFGGGADIDSLPVPNSGAGFASPARSYSSGPSVFSFQDRDYLIHLVQWFLQVMIRRLWGDLGAIYENGEVGFTWKLLFIVTTGLFLQVLLSYLERTFGSS